MDKYLNKLIEEYDQNNKSIIYDDFIFTSKEDLISTIKNYRNNIFKNISVNSELIDLLCDFFIRDSDKKNPNRKIEFIYKFLEMFVTNFSTDTLGIDKND